MNNRNINSSAKKAPSRYRIVRRELLTKRLKWVTHFLLSLSPELYQPGDYDHVKSAMDFIHNKIKKLGILEHHSRLFLKYDKNLLAFTNKQQVSYLSFSIEKV